jgi:predicted nuclease of predicted toxin-antitoxin system
VSLRFFADQCVPGSVIQRLQDAGHEVLQLKDYIPVDSPDQLVISKAQELDAILLSLNGDFADIVTYPPAKYKGIVALQVRNHPEIIPQLLEMLTAYLSAHNDIEHYSGKLLIAETHRIRSRR